MNFNTAENLHRGRAGSLAYQRFGHSGDILIMREVTLC